jgi:hypothetical protein
MQNENWGTEEQEQELREILVEDGEVILQGVGMLVLSCAVSLGRGQGLVRSCRL